MIRSLLDVEELLVAYLQPVAPGRVSVQLPNNPVLPYIVVTRLPAGGFDGITDSPSVDVDVYDVDRASASSTAAQMNTLMLALRPQVTVTTPSGRARVDYVNTIHAPAWIDYRDPDIQRYNARYEIGSRVIITN